MGLPISRILPSGKQTVCELENGPVEIVYLPINSMVDLSIVMLVYQRVDGWIQCEAPKI